MGFFKQIGIGAIISALFAILYVYLRPIANKFENLLQTIALMAIFLNLSVGVMLKISDEDINPDVNLKADATGVSVLLIFINSMIILIVSGWSLFGEGEGGVGWEDDSHTGYYGAALC